MLEAAGEAVEQPGKSLSWHEIIKSDPKAQEGIFNPYRKTLLEKGVYVNATPLTAEMWIPELRTRRQTAEQVAQARGEALPKRKGPIRITITNIPQETINNPSDGKIMVSADGLEAEINCSVFYNCIPGKDTTPIGFSSGGNLMGHGDSLPTRGEGSHSTFDRPGNI